MESDPHDALLLTRRPTTVVSQHTRMFDRMPAPYGAQEDEERLFSGVGADDGAADLATKLAADRAAIVSTITGVAPAGTAAATVAAPVAVVSKVPKAALIAGAALAAWFLFFRK
jgi:hypothetical protein